jgi:hypothetical protein
MIIGNPSVFALESVITRAYERLSFRALGLFTVHVSGRRYGVYEPDATMLAGSLDQVGRRVENRGRHTAPFATDQNAGNIADAFRNVVYNIGYDADSTEEYLGLAAAAFDEVVHANKIEWPGGDEEFDDGSYLLQFDIGDRVRLIAFQCGEDGLHNPATLRDLWLPSNEFYNVLKRWSDSFNEEWIGAQRVPLEMDGAETS